MVFLWRRIVAIDSPLKQLSQRTFREEPFISLKTHLQNVTPSLEDAWTIFKLIPFFMKDMISRLFTFPNQPVWYRPIYQNIAPEACRSPFSSSPTASLLLSVHPQYASSLWYHTCNFHHSTSYIPPFLRCHIRPSTWASLHQLPSSLDRRILS